eukprot:4368937-Prymnesium_polylepis.1
MEICVGKQSRVCFIRHSTADTRHESVEDGPGDTDVRLRPLPQELQLHPQLPMRLCAPTQPGLALGPDNWRRRRATRCRQRSSLLTLARAGHCHSRHPSRVRMHDS